MRLYAKRVNLPLDQAFVAVSHSRDKDRTPQDRFNRDIRLVGDLTAEQRDKLLSIADRCPVDLTLVRGSDVVTELVETQDKSRGGDSNG
jgi:putative redox protein